MYKNLKIIIEIINNNIAILNKYGYEIYDTDNLEFYLSKIQYDSEEDKLKFECKEDI